MKKQSALLITIVIFALSCNKQKTDIQFNDSNNPQKEFNHSRFFPESANENQTIKRIFSYLKNENSKKEFLTAFVKIAGYPRWDKAIIQQVNHGNSLRNESLGINDSTCIIPLVQENKSSLNGVIIAHISGDSISCGYSLLNNYNLLKTGKKDFVLAMLKLDAKLFNHKSFKINDTTLFGNARTIVVRKREQAGNINARNSVHAESDDPCEIIEIWYDPTAEACHCSGDEYYTGDWEYAGDCPTGEDPGFFFFSSGGGGSIYSISSGFDGGGGGGGGSSTPPYLTSFQDQLDYLLSQLDLSPESSDFLSNSEPAVTETYNYLYNNSTFTRIQLASSHVQRLASDPAYSLFVDGYRQYRSIYSSNPTSLWWQDSGFLSKAGGIAFGSWAINYLSQNQDLPFSTFHNWFFKQAEYTGGEDAIDPSQITYEQPVQQIALPSLSSFETAFPKEGTNGNYTQMDASDVYQLVGGSLYQSHLNNPDQYSNACSIRGSRALLYSGITIPVLKYGASGQRTQKGGDNKNYILDAVSFNRFMIDKFGDSPHKLTGADANDPQKVADLLKDKNGIYVIINNDGSATTGAGYSGHVDLILNGECIGGALTNPNGGVKSIRIWVLN